jgi:hypothetical protein
MSIFGTRDSGPKIVQNGLGLWFDAGQTVSYPRTGTSWTDRASGAVCTIGGSYAYYTGNGGYFSDFGNFDTTFQIATSYSASSLAGLTMQAVVYFGRNQYEQATILGSTNSGGNNFKLTPTGIASDGGGRNAYTTLVQNAWYFISCTRDVASLSLSVRINNGARTTNTYASLGNVNFTDGWMISATRAASVVLLEPRVATVLFYTRTLSSDEELQNFNALRIRYGI